MFIAYTATTSDKKNITKNDSYIVPAKTTLRAITVIHGEDVIPLSTDNQVIFTMPAHTIKTGENVAVKRCVRKIETTFLLPKGSKIKIKDEKSQQEKEYKIEKDMKLGKLENGTQENSYTITTKNIIAFNIFYQKPKRFTKIVDKTDQSTIIEKELQNQMIYKYDIFKLNALKDTNLLFKTGTNGEFVIDKKCLDKRPFVKYEIINDSAAQGKFEFIPERNSPEPFSIKYDGDEKKMEKINKLENAMLEGNNGSLFFIPHNDILAAINNKFKDAVTIKFELFCDSDFTSITDDEVEITPVQIKKDDTDKKDDSKPTGMSGGKIAMIVVLVVLVVIAIIGGGFIYYKFHVMNKNTVENDIWDM